MNIAFETPDQPEVTALIAELDAYQDTLYPAESRHALDLSTLANDQVLFAVARDAQGRAFGCGAIVLRTAHGEIRGELKRMYVQPGHRGQGAAAALLRMLEARARERGCTWLMLETGPYQPEALRLYERHGYTRRGPFGGYRDDPLSVFMHKPLEAGPHTPEPEHPTLTA